jgi:hypothetical protein
MLVSIPWDLGHIKGTYEYGNQTLGKERLQALPISTSSHHPRVRLDLLISARIHPILHTSMAFVYSWNAASELRTPLRGGWQLTKHNLWGSVPPRSDVFRHETPSAFWSSIRWGFSSRSSESKITDLNKSIS